jgi:GNAT superfamily N-acetyltransferase
MRRTEFEITPMRDLDQVRRCYPLFRILRPHLDEQTFVDRWRVQSDYGYQIVAIESGADIAAAAGFREMTTLAWGKILYLDDLIANDSYRGLGYGTALLEFLQAEVVARGCDQLHLDSGYTRNQAHRTYLRNGFNIVSHHFSWVPADT